MSLGLVCITHVPPQLGSECAVCCFRGLFSLAFLVPVIEITGVFVRLRLRPRQRPRQRPRSARSARYDVTKSRRFDSSGAVGGFGRFLGARGGRTAIPQLFPQQFRSSSAAAPQQLRSSSAVVPCYLRSRSVLPPQSFRFVTSAVAQTKRPHHHRHRLGTHTVEGCGLRYVHHHGNGRERESRGANPATDA